MSREPHTLLTRSAVELAGMVRSGEIKSRELIEAALHRIEARADLNAFTYVDADGALAAADAIEPGDPRPFAGLPIAIKELNAVAGQPLTLGSNLLGNYRPTYDAYVVRRIREAGFVLVGRTNSPEFGIVPVTEPRRFGSTRNPWDLGRTPGGSSGGAAAAVAGGILPLAHASDGGGSIRIPAACCGLVGLKPSRSRISCGPDEGDNFLSTSGVLTRTVEDSARMLDVMAGYEIGDATWAPPPPEPFAVTAARPPRRLRIAMTTVSPMETEIDPTCARAVHDAAKLLTSLGHDVKEVVPPSWQRPDLMPLFATLYATAIAGGVMYGGLIAGREATREDVEALTWGFYELGKSLGATDLAAAKTQLQVHSRTMVGFFSSHDVLLIPSLGQRPLPIGTIDVNNADNWLGEFQKAAEFTPFTAIWNITGQPAISLPLYQGDDGLPLGVQIVGPPLGEALLLSLAAELEAAQPWAGRLPN